MEGKLTDCVWHIKCEGGENKLNDCANPKPAGHDIVSLTYAFKSQLSGTPKQFSDSIK